MESKLQGALYFEIFENHILKLKNLDVGNVVLYQHAKYQIKIIHILAM